MLISNLLVLKNIVVVSAIVWTCLIAYSCLVTFSKLPEIEVPGADKYVHSIFHFVFTILWGCTSWLRETKINIKKIVTIVLISIAFGLLIELLQEMCTTTRKADAFDVLANVAGALIALLAFIIVKKTSAKIRYTVK